MEIVDIIPNARGGWSLLVQQGQVVHAIGNYASYANALRIARWNGYTEAKKSALSK